ncbi:MAG: Indole-3-glycerol phosphate synthase, partial [uncultured Lysobacter sp.]
ERHPQHHPRAQGRGDRAAQPRAFDHRPACTRAGPAAHARLHRCNQAQAFGRRCGGHCRSEKGQPVERPDPQGVRSGGDRAQLRGRRRGLPVGADGRGFLPGQQPVPGRRARRLHAAGAAQGFHDRSLPGVRGSRDRRRRDPADRRRAGGRADDRDGEPRARAGHGRAGGSARHRRARARAADRLRADRREQPQPAHVRGLARHHDRAARCGADRPHAGHRKRHRHARGRREDARRRHRDVPDRRKLHARARPRRGAAAAVRAV